MPLDGHLCDTHLALALSLLLTLVVVSISGP